MHQITLIPGDGIGPSIVDAAVNVIEATGVKIHWDRQLAGMAAVEKYADPLPDATIESIRNNRICFKGPLTTPVGGGTEALTLPCVRRSTCTRMSVLPFPSTESIHRSGT